MPRNIIQDVVPPEKRTIRNIPVLPRRAAKKNFGGSGFSRPSQNENEGYEPAEEPRWPVKPLKSRSVFFGKFFIVVGLLVVIVFSVFIMTIFSSAKVSISPKRENIAVNLPISFASYEVAEAVSETQKQVPADGEENVENKASGQIIVYNNFSSESQRLVARTRFQSSDGLVYRIAESITVPGRKTIAGKEEPGSIEATVYADEAGDKYNIGNTEFTIPGFKDDPQRFSKFYAKSKTPMTGGFVGVAKKVSESEKQKAETEMKNVLREDLEKDLLTKVPEGYVLLKGSVFYEFNELPQGSVSGNGALLKMEGRAKAALFEKKTIESALSQEYLAAWEGLPVEVESYDSLNANFADGVDLSSSPIDVSITGETPVAAKIDEEQISEKLLGQPKSNLKVIMVDFPAVVSAKVVVKPFWKGAFPSDASKIHIEVEETASQ